MKYEDFSGEFLKQRSPFSSFVISDLYIKRSDAYLNSGNWLRAADDFRRVLTGFPDDETADRWREIAQSATDRTYIDMKTFDASRPNSVKFWIREAPSDANDGAGPYSVQQFELNCAAGQIRAGSFASYDATGKFTGGREGGKWTGVIPDTMGETLYNGVCRSN